MGLLVGCATVRRGCGCMSADDGLGAAFARVESVSVLPESPGGGFPLYVAVPPYSRMLTHHGKAGFAVVRISVGEEGVVRAVEIVDTTHRELGAAIEEAAWNWRFVEIPDPLTGRRHGLEIECRLAFAGRPN